MLQASTPKRFIPHLVNDGFAHKVLIQVEGNKVFLTVDEKQPQSVVNDGKMDRFEIASKSYLYIGGLPKEQLYVAKEKFHILGSTSLIGITASAMLMKYGCRMH